MGQQVAAYTFEYFSYGKWYVGDRTGDHGTSLFNTDTAAAGMELDVTLTSATSYHLSMTPLNNPANAYSLDGTLKTDDPIDWIQFQFYNTTADSGLATDFYVSSITISEVPEPSTLAFIGLGFAGLLFMRRRK